MKPSERYEVGRRRALVRAIIRALL